MNADDAVECTCSQVKSIRVKRKARNWADSLAKESFVKAELRYGVSAIGKYANLPESVHTKK